MFSFYKDVGIILILLQLSNNDAQFTNSLGGNTQDPRFKGGQSLILFSENIGYLN